MCSRLAFNGWNKAHFPVVITGRTDKLCSGESKWKDKARDDFTSAIGGVARFGGSVVVSSRVPMGCWGAGCADSYSAGYACACTAFVGCNTYSL